MAQPAAYDRSFSFTNFQAANPSSSLPGDELDAELNNVKATSDQTLENIALIQRDDGALANDSVGRDQLSAEVSVGFNAPGVWAQHTAYVASADTVFYQAVFYRCITSHTSGTTFDATKWEVIVDLSSLPGTAASNITFVPAGTVAASTVQAAIEEVDAEKALLVHTHAASAISDSTSAGRALLLAASVAAQLTALGITNRYFQPGDWKYTDCISLETGWLWRDGSSYLRATYPALFAAISITTTGTTTNGSPIVTVVPSTAEMRAGMPISGDNISGFAATILSVDSSTQITLSANAIGTGTLSPLIVAPFGVADATHFNVPEARGRAAVARDDMGGAIAGRITVAGTGVAGTRLGAPGGAETHALTTPQLASHTHVATSVVTDPEHIHSNPIQSVNETISVGSTSMILPGGNINTGFSATGITVATSNATAGSGTAHNNMGPFLVCNSVIKT